MLAEVAIIGAGPAGLAAAVQLRRYDLNPLLFERGMAGGLVLNANLVENYPGFPSGIPGPELAQLFIQQAERAGVHIIYEEVKSLNYDGRMFQVNTSSKTYSCHIVIVASGTRPRLFTEFSIPPSLKDRVMYEIHPLLHLKDKQMAIVGGGDAAFDYALNLGRQNQVIMINRSEQRHCLPLLWERAMATPAISYWENTSIINVAEDPKHGVALECLRAGNEVRLCVDFLIGAIGREPQLEFFSASLNEMRAGLQAAGRLYLIGDVINGICRQTSIAVGQGVQTAMQIRQILVEEIA